MPFSRLSFPLDCLPTCLQSLSLFLWPSSSTICVCSSQHHATLAFSAVVELAQRCSTGAYEEPDFTSGAVAICITGKNTSKCVRTRSQKSAHLEKMWNFGVHPHLLVMRLSICVLILFCSILLTEYRHYCNLVISDHFFCSIEHKPNRTELRPQTSPALERAHSDCVSWARHSGYIGLEK